MINFAQIFGNGSVAQNVYGEGAYGTFLSVNWAWGIAVMMGVWVAGGVSGKSGSLHNNKAGS